MADDLDMYLWECGHCHELTCMHCEQACSGGLCGCDPKIREDRKRLRRERAEQLKALAIQKGKFQTMEQCKQEMPALYETLKREGLE